MSASVISGMGELPNWSVRIRYISKRWRGVLQVKDSSQQKNETCNGQIYPLHFFKCRSVFGGILEENIRTHDGSDDCSDSIKSLRDVDVYFSVPRWATNYHWPLVTRF